jgi:type III secretion protein V
MVVGGVIFLILVIIQFLVIAKGSERVAEVAARFTLDAMPGKQMAIDADLRAGAFDLEEGKRRRRNLERESQLYGSMDGAMKFVKGDAIAGMIITLINIIAGMIIGILQKGYTAGEAAETFSLLTIGDGLVGQIPALLISTAAGIIVTRVASEEGDSHLGKDIGTQILSQPKAIAIASGFLGVLALIPGLPKVPFLIMGLATGTLAFGLVRTKKRLEEEPEEAPVSEEQKALAEGEELFLPFPTPISLDVSPQLTPLVDTAQEGGMFLAEGVPLVREGLYLDLGVRFPGIRIRGDAGELGPDMFVINVFEVPVVTGRIYPGKVLVNQTVQELASFRIEAEEGYNPSDGMPAAWIDEASRPLVEQAGATCWDSAGYILLCLTGTLKHYAHDFVGIQEVQGMLDKMDEMFPTLVKEVVPKLLTPYQLTDVLKKLVQEQISIRDLRTILQALAEAGQFEKDTVALTEYVRQALRRYISFKYSRGRNTLAVYLLDPEIEDIVKSSIQHLPSGSYLALEPDISTEILQSVRREVGNTPASAQQPVVLTNPDIRRYFRRLVEMELPNLAVLSYQELTPEMNIQPLARISLGQG